MHERENIKISLSFKRLPQVAMTGGHAKVRAGRYFQLGTRDYKGTPSERGSMLLRRINVYTEEEEARLRRLCQAMGSAQREEMGRCKANNVLMQPNMRVTERSKVQGRKSRLGPDDGNFNSWWKTIRKI